MKENNKGKRVNVSSVSAHFQLTMIHDLILDEGAFHRFNLIHNYYIFQVELSQK